MGASARFERELYPTPNTVQRVPRFYMLSVQPDLFAGWSVVWEWGCIGRVGRVRIDAHADLADAAEGASRAGNADCDGHCHSEITGADVDEGPEPHGRCSFRGPGINHTEGTYAFCA